MTLAEQVPLDSVDLADVDLLDAFAQAQDLLGGSPAYQRLRLRAADRFLIEHPDLSVWMQRPLGDHLGEISADAHTWPLLTFAMVSTRVQGDLELLLAKNFGHSVRRWVTGLYPHQTQALLAAADPCLSGMRKQRSWTRKRAWRTATPAVGLRSVSRISRFLISPARGTADRPIASNQRHVV